MSWATPSRTGLETRGRTVNLELQADCFAGAWTRDLATGQSRFCFEHPRRRPRPAGGRHVEVPRRARARPPYDPSGPRQRVRPLSAAFQEGYENGKEKCAEYANPDEDRRTAEIPFHDQDYETEGDLPLEDDWDGQGSLGLYSMVEQDLNEFYGWCPWISSGRTWTPVEDLVVVDPTTDEVTCGGDELSGTGLEYAALYCEDENVVVLDGAGLAGDLYEHRRLRGGQRDRTAVGDGRQSQLGVGDGDEATLQADCMTGFWGAWTFPAVGDVAPRGRPARCRPATSTRGSMGFMAYSLRRQQADGVRAMPRCGPACSAAQRVRGVRPARLTGAGRRPTAGLRPFGGLGPPRAGRARLRRMRGSRGRRCRPPRRPAARGRGSAAAPPRSPASVGSAARVRPGDDVLVGCPGCGFSSSSSRRCAGAVVSGGASGPSWPAAAPGATGCGAAPAGTGLAISTSAASARARRTATGGRTTAPSFDAGHRQVKPDPRPDAELAPRTSPRADGRRQSCRSGGQAGGV